MRKITIPDTVTLEGQPITFASFIRDTVLLDLRWGLDVETVRLCREVWDAVGTTMVISEKAWTLLAEVIRKPHNGYNPRAAVHLLGYFDAVLQASVTESDPGQDTV